MSHPAGLQQDRVFNRTAAWVSWPLGSAQMLPECWWLSLQWASCKSQQWSMALVRETLNPLVPDTFPQVTFKCLGRDWACEKGGNRSTLCTSVCALGLCVRVLLLCFLTECKVSKYTPIFIKTLIFPIFFYFSFPGDKPDWHLAVASNLDGWYWFHLCKPKTSHGDTFEHQHGWLFW